MDGYISLLAGMALVAAIGAMALAFRRHARALEASRCDALTDTLTGLGNRRKLLEDLEDVLCEPGASRLLVILDLDGFKAYNDIFGHPAGDALLARLGRRIEAALRSGGRAYRLGGDEFCALIENCGSHYEAIVAAVSASGDGVSASHGMIALPWEADSPQAALQLADRRLYADKSEHGRPSQRREIRDALAEALGTCEAAPEGSDLVPELAGRAARRLGLWGEQLELVVRASELRDVGKAAIPEAILAKRQPLDLAERQLLSQHTLVGERMLSSAEAFAPVARLVRACDERWDGAGYPDGLAGEHIPLGARIVAACEGFRALTEGDGQPARAALLRLRQQAGSRFDPEVVEAVAAATALTPAAKTGRRAKAGMLATVAVGAALLLLPGSALAGTASVYNGKLSVTASPGQANKLTISSAPESNGTIVQEEGAGASITPGTGCSAYAPGKVYCSATTSINVDAGDGNDTVVGQTWTPLSLRGGKGDDSLWGGGGKDLVDGQEGNDMLGGGFGGDTIKGGPGADTANYSYYTGPVAVSLDGRANDGMLGEGANVGADVENIIGGKGADTLAGDGDANLIEGGPGSDTLSGAGGDDSFRAVDGEHDSVSCGAGFDSVVADSIDALSSDCDSSLLVSRPHAGLAPTTSPLRLHSRPLRLQTKPARLTRKGIAPLRLRCFANVVEGCRGTLTIVAPSSPTAKASRAGRRRVIGKARFFVRHGRVAVVKVRISRDGRRRVLRRRKLRCRTSLAVRRSDGSLTTISSGLTLIPPKAGSR